MNSNARLAMGWNPRRPMKGKVGSQMGILVLCIAISGVVVMCSLLYLSFLLSPTFLRRIAQEVIQCDQTNDFFAHSSSPPSNPKANRPPTSTSYSPPSPSSPPLHDHQIKVLANQWNSSEVESKQMAQKRSLRIFIGIMTIASKIDRRNLLRMAYAVQKVEMAEMTIRFIVGKLDNEMDKTVVGMEQIVYGDMMELECEENMNDGKSYTFFSTLAKTYNSSKMDHHHYDYVMKTDDDSYVRINNLARHLQPLPRSDLYYGYILPCENDDPYKWYMAGMGYVISWDLVEWIRDSPIARNRTSGTEDKLVGEWFDEGGKARNRVNDKPLFYDHPDFGGNCAHELIHETILIHQVKTSDRWANVLAFFERESIVRALPREPSPLPLGIQA